MDDLGIGVYPGPNDVIITGRSYQERISTLEFLRSNGINNEVFFNPLPFNEKTRESSGQHKGNVLNKLKDAGYTIQLHYEDDLVQIQEIKKLCPWLNVIHVNTNGLIELENVER
jgi:hypothetical protein